MRREITALAAAAAAAAAAYMLLLRRRQQDPPAVPVTRCDKRGTAVLIRLANANDLEAVKEHIADHTGTGSGTGGDLFLIQEFVNNVEADGCLAGRPNFSEQARSVRPLRGCRLTLNATPSQVYRALCDRGRGRGRGRGDRAGDAHHRLVVRYRVVLAEPTCLSWNRTGYPPQLGLTWWGCWLPHTCCSLLCRLLTTLSTAHYFVAGQLVLKPTHA